MTAKLSGQRLTILRGERCLVRSLSFALNPGQLLLLEGENGSGKTSLMRAIAGTLTPEEGDIAWNGESISTQRQHYHGSIAWLGHKAGLKGDLTMLENLQFERSLRPQSNVDVNAVFKRLGIERLRKLPVRALSAGQQRRVALARLVFSAVPLWLLDEPYTNLDRDGRGLVDTLVGEHLGRGGLCVMAAHQNVAIDVPTERIALS